MKTLDKELLIHALELYSFPIDKELIKVTDKTLEFFREIGLDDELICFFTQFSFRYSFNFEDNTFLCVNKMRTENLDSLNKEIYKYHLLIIGSGRNGDLIVLNTKSWSVGYVFHDELWEDEAFSSISDIYIDLNVSLGRFYYKSATDEQFPIDAASAEIYLDNNC